ncbi:MAG: sensor histidine kinase [Xanthomonadales bacterium]|nr:sensor histidine kinase [Xanthomonadales bacterium]NIQ93779.1 sensor histidine kinase [Desulfuromonadales bacterium]NIX13442.1 sensor histidine kinase [Xanthomonadales bacterium]
MQVPHFIKDQSHLFWVLHLGGWLAWGLFGKYLYTRATLEELPPDYFLYVMLITAIGMLLTLVLRYLYRFLWDRALWLQALGILGGSLAAGYAWLRCRSTIYSGWIQKSEDMEAWFKKMGPLAELSEKVSYLETFTSALTVVMGWSVLYFVIKYYQVLQDARESALKSAAMAHEAQLKMLRYQLNPHFLFNTLNAISTLVLERSNELANRMVTRLSSFLRYSLDNDPLQKTTLDEEIAALRLYLDIEKVRFEERLGLEFAIGEQAHKAMIPSLLLQPLVENSIKYAIARSEDGGTLRIAAEVMDDVLQIEVSDDGPGVDLVDGGIPGATGVGLRNTRERLQQLYGERHSVSLSHTDPHGLTVIVRIPFETDRPAQ